ncbi:MAG: dTDP-4-dehydrorhamnose 3,5-epimerase [Proteobacteria bacterium]|nr:dTDP-4-dehydrorhamnose 3,5-epimerase [Pseudomonadota bacterium]MDE3207968.1 dTDP-4-dehydrorhamnose 3,5-epimerase [Pseudomonadota bacterium]
MKVVSTVLPGVLLVEPQVFSDDRGFFFESFNERDFSRETGLTPHFVQDNFSSSRRHVLRGLHYQIVEPQAKLVRVVKGAAYDVVVDIRKSAPTFGQWFGVELSDVNHWMLWIPEGFAHGFLALSEEVQMVYKTSRYWNKEAERSLLWSDPDIGIRWPLEGPPILSPKDTMGQRLAEAEVFA